MRTLQAGDILYLASTLGNTKWYYRYEVESVNKTHAILKNKTKVQINGGSFGYKVANSNSYYELETPRLKEAYELQLAVKNLLNAVDKLKDSLNTLCLSLPIDTIKQLTQHLNDTINENI